MNSDELVRLSRSGKLFCAVSRESMCKIHALRRLLCIDTPKTVAAVNADDAGVARCTSEDALFAALYQYILRGTAFHTRFDEAPADSPSCAFADAPDAYFTLESVLNTDERPARVMPRPYGCYEPAIRAPPTLVPTFRVASGTSLKSLARVSGPLCRRVPHRCSVQIMRLPEVDPAAAEAMVANTPQRFNTTVPVGSPRSDPDPVGSAALAEAHRTSQHFKPNCCFGLYCPGLEEERQVNALMPSRAPYTSARWFGLYWAAGATIPQLALVAGVTADGQPRAHHVHDGVVLSVGDVLSVETQPKPAQAPQGYGGLSGPPPAVDIVFFVNGAEVARVAAAAYMPACRHLEGCYFGVQLCTGAAVAILNGDAP